MLPASFGVGTLLLTWTVYIISWFFSVVGKAENPLLYGNIIGMTGAAVIMILLSVQKYRKQGSYRIWNIDKTQDKRRLKKEILLFGLLTVFITYMMFYVFYIKDGILYSGLTVYGDYAPHTAMMRSFSAGNNFPTQYPHYGGADVKYHFMFQFLRDPIQAPIQQITSIQDTISILQQTDPCLFLVFHFSRRFLCIIQENALPRNILVDIQFRRFHL